MSEEHSIETVSDVTEIESLCMKCHENGVTRLLLTKIPFYRDVVLSSFECEHCGERNNQVQAAQSVQQDGVQLTLQIRDSEDVNRTLVRSEHATISVPDIQLEIPATCKRAEVTTVEGVLRRALDDLEKDQPVRRHMDPPAALKIDEFLHKLRDVVNLSTPASLVVDDVSGNSFISNPTAPSSDPALTCKRYRRSAAQDEYLGVTASHNDSSVNDQDGEGVAKEGLAEQIDAAEVLTFDTDCPNCRQPCCTNMKVTDIPHFKQVVIMATTCDHCGCKTNEVKAATGISELAQKFTVLINSPADLQRDVLKSETCDIEIPELEVCVGGATISGRFTTTEGLLVCIKDDLSSNPMLVGDSVSADTRARIDELCRRIDDVIAGRMCAHLVLDDPAGNSYVQMLDYSGPDENYVLENYERSFEQNESLGLNDMKTENY